MTLELAVANVLEKLAVYLDAEDAEKRAAHDAEQKKLVSEVRQKISEATGQDIDDEVAAKMAKADPDILKTIGTLAESTDIAELGSPSTRKTASAPMNKNEAAEVAGDNLITFCVS